MIARLAELVRRDHWPPPTGAAPLASGLETGVGALADQIALELGQRAEDVEHQHPARSCGIDVFGELAEPDTPRRQLADFFDQMAHRATKTIEFPDHQRVAATQVGERLVRARPIGFCSGCVIVEYPVAPASVQCVELERELLVCGRDARYPQPEP